MPEPITREETFLAAAAGESVTLPTPVTREELFLAKLAGENVETPTPVTRKEMFLEAAAQGGGAPNLQSKTVSPTTSQQTVSPDSGYDGLSSVTVNAIYPTKSAQTYTPGTTNQTINAGRWLTGAQTILGEADLVPSNIKDGVSIFGIIGTYSGALDFYDGATDAGGGTMYFAISGDKNGVHCDCYYSKYISEDWGTWTPLAGGSAVGYTPTDPSAFNGLLTDGTVDSD